MYYGVGIIDGNMRKLLSSVISHMSELMSGSWDIETGITLYDKLSESQKLAGLYIIGKAWFTEEVRVDHPTLIHDAIVGAILQECRGNIQYEIDTEKEDLKNPYRYFWRTKLINAANDLIERLQDGEPEYEKPNIPTKKCRDFRKWDELMDEIFFGLEEDNDYDLGIIHPDNEEMKDLIDTHFCAEKTVTINRSIHLPMEFRDCWLAKQMEERKEEDIPVVQTLETAIYKMNYDYNNEDYEQ